MGFSRSEHYDKMSIPELIEALDGNAQAGSDTYQFIQNVLLAKSTQAVNQGLLGTAEAIGKSTTELSPKLDRLNKELGETKAKIETAGKVVSDVVDARAREIGADLQQLTSALAKAGSDLQSAGNQSATVAAKLNNFTLVLANLTLHVLRSEVAE